MLRLSGPLLAMARAPSLWTCASPPQTQGWLRRLGQGRVWVWVWGRQPGQGRAGRLHKGPSGLPGRQRWPGRRVRPRSSSASAARLLSWSSAPRWIHRCHKGLRPSGVVMWHGICSYMGFVKAHAPWGCKGREAQPGCPRACTAARRQHTSIAPLPCCCALGTCIHDGPMAASWQDPGGATIL